VAWRAVLSWLVGFAVTIPFIGSATLPWLSQPWQGPLAHLLGGMDLSGIIGAVVSGLLYLLLNLPRLRQQQAARRSETAAAS
jgi:NCS1 family nucleobase:cation symporter-1